jgi:ankyrin repeat protein
LLHLAAKFNNNRKVFVGADSGTNNQELDNVSHKISTTYCQKAWDQASIEGYTPVHVAAYYSNNAFIQYVLEKVDSGKEHVLKPTQNIRKMNVLHICVEQSATSSEKNQDKNKSVLSSKENQEDKNKSVLSSKENQEDKNKCVL